MFIENYRKFLKYYGAGRKTRLFGFAVLSFIAGCFEFAGIALIYPFVLLMIAPHALIQSTIYTNIADMLNTDSVSTIATVIGILTVSLFIVKNVFMIWVISLQNKFVNHWKLDINRIFMSYYLYSPFKNSLKTPPADKIYNLTFLTSNTLDGFILRGINVITNAIVVVIIISFLFSKFPVAAIVTTIFVGVTMVLQSKFFKKRTTEIAKELFKTSTKSNNKTIEIINNIKELKILCAEDYFYDSYIKSQKDLNGYLFLSNYYNSIPTYIIEILIVVALLVMAGIISLQNQSTSATIASYSVIVAAIFRIAPCLSKIQNSINVMNNSRGFVKAMLKEYENIDFNSLEIKTDLKINFEEKITLRNIDFSYNTKPVIKNLNLEIQKGEFIGIVGPSGAGKSTLADIIMGLLPINQGDILVDGFRLSQEHFSTIREFVGYVPQQINIFDGSFKANIAWGKKDEEIDEDKIIKSLKMAQLYDFVASFEGGVNSIEITGSTGISQGQKQRLAIARALYKDPSILILDEATSSLDVETEYEITKMLEELKGKKTIIAIAHRLSTLKSCDRLIYIKEGTIIDSGSFSELANKHADFEKLIKLSNINNG